MFGGSASGDGSDAPNKAEEAAGALTREDFAQRIADAQLKAKTTHFEMDVSREGFDMEAEGDMEISESIDDLKFSTQMRGIDGQAGKVRMLNSELFVNIDTMPDKKYFKIDLGDTGNKLAEEYSDVPDMFDPLNRIEQMDKSVEDFTKKDSSENIDGTSTQPYDITIDTSEDSLPETSMSTNRADRYTYTIYVDANDLVHRITAEGSELNASIEYTQWGEPVDIAKPDKANVTDQAPN